MDRDDRTKTCAADAASSFPCLNEAESYRQRCSTQLGAVADRLDMRIVVVDGGSTDGTRAIVESIAAANPRVALLAQSDKRIQSAAINLAVAEFGDDFD